MAVNLDDVRYLDTDHFVPFHQPAAIARTVLEVLTAHSRSAIGSDDLRLAD
jgi:hypothetical protein